jgi:hypothetical protein
MLILLQGRGNLLRFSADGETLDRLEMSAAVPVAQIKAGVWHGFIVLEPDTAVMEVKPGPISRQNLRTGRRQSRIATLRCSLSRSQVPDGVIWILQQQSYCRRSAFSMLFGTQSSKRNELSTLAGMGIANVALTLPLPFILAVPPPSARPVLAVSLALLFARVRTRQFEQGPRTEISLTRVLFRANHL